MPWNSRGQKQPSRLDPARKSPLNPPFHAQAKTGASIAGDSKKWFKLIFWVKVFEKFISLHRLSFANIHCSVYKYLKHANCGRSRPHISLLSLKPPVRPHRFRFKPAGIQDWPWVSICIGWFLLRRHQISKNQDTIHHRTILSVHTYRLCNLWNIIS